MEGALDFALRGDGDRSRKKRLRARAAWERAVGWRYLKEIQDAGREIDPADLPPGLEWEEPVWDLYVCLSTQWRYSFGGRAGLDYGPALELARERGMDVERSIALLRSIEIEILEWDQRENERERPGQG